MRRYAKIAAAVFLATLAALSLAQVTTNPAVTGIGIQASPTLSSYLKGNGSQWITSTGSASGTGACAANTWASTLNSDAAPTCTQPATTNLSDVTTSSFTVTLTGVDATVTGTAYYTKVGTMVTITTPLLDGTSNTNAKTLTGMPAGIRPTSSTPRGAVAYNDNGATGGGWYSVGSNGTITLQTATFAGWTASGAFRHFGTSMTYSIQ